MAASELSKGAEVGKSTFARVTAMVYWLIMLEVMFLLFTAPGWVATLFLAADSSNIPLYVACLLPLGPAVAALVFAWRRRELEGPDLAPARRFWRGYRLNFGDVLRWWAPFLALVAAGGFVAVNLPLIGLPAGLAWVFVGLGALAGLWAAHMLVMTAVFSFRTRDASRLAIHFFFRCFPATLLFLSLLVVCFACTYLVGTWLPILAGSVLSQMYVRAAAKEMDIVTAEFIAPPPEEPEDPGWPEDPAAPATPAKP